MALVNGRYTPESITSIVRKAIPSSSKIIVRTRIPTQEKPSPYVYADADITVGQTAATRRMIQKTNSATFYEFTFPPTQIAYEGMGVEIQEIPRPLQKPLIDVRGGKNYKAVFEFLVAGQFDGLNESIEQQLVTLQSFANSGEPVYFENFDTFLTNGFWYIAEFSIKTSRVNTKGEIVAAQCSIGLLEYQSTDTKFAKFPKLDYSSMSNRKKGGGGGGGGGGENEPISTSAEIKIEGYRWTRTEKPSAIDTYANAWIKVKGKNQWVLYSKTELFPYDASAFGYKAIRTKIVDDKLTKAQRQNFKTSTDKTITGTPTKWVKQK
jgi:hypothetical protein